MAKWEGLRSVGLVESVRQVGEEAPTVERRYYLSSLAVDVETFARAVRGHWSVENSTALGAGRAMPRGREPRARGAQRGKPGDAAAAGAQSLEERPHEKARHQRQTTQRGLESGLPAPFFGLLMRPP